MVQAKSKIVTYLKSASKFATLAVFVIATSVLWAWSRYPHISGFLYEHLVAMNPSTAIALILGSLSLALLHSSAKTSQAYRTGLVLAGILVVGGSIRLVEYGLDVQPILDRLLFAAKLNGNRIAPLTALSAVFTGLALILIDRQTDTGRWPSQYFSLSVAAFSLLTIVGHLYHVTALISRHLHYTPMALLTGLGLLLLALGTLCARPEQGLMQVITSEGVGGLTARRLMPAAIVVPLILGYIFLKGGRLGWYGMDFSDTVFALSVQVISVALVWWVSVSLHRLEADRLLAERENKESQIFLSSVLENIPDMIFIKDAKDLRFVSFNKAGEELLGHPRSMLLGKNDYDFFPREQADFFVAKDREVLANGKLLIIPEEPIETPHGQRILHTKKMPINDAEGKPAFLLGISEDITSRKLVEEELFQGKKLQAVGLLAAGVAHQINNPITVILGFAQYLCTQVAKGDRLYNAVESIERETRRCRTLIQDLLAFSRKKGTRVAAVNPIVVLNSALSLIESQTGVKNIQLVRHIPNDLPKFEVDAQQIQEVIINLCLNAIDAMPTGGTLTIQAERKADPHVGDTIELRLTDTGQGIPEDIRQRIFEPFFTTKPVGEGTGLGLSLCYGIVKSHRGQIEVQSEIGKGTTFIVRLPLHAHQAGSMDAQSSAA
jgi:PAS domain S-box-containing protein